MKKLSLILAFVSTTAFAHPGSHTLVCKSPKNTKLPITVNIHRANGTGWYEPEMTVTVNDKAYNLTATDLSQDYGETFHNSPLGVIRVTANNYVEADPVVLGSLSVVAIPSTVKAFDYEGKPVKWNLEAEKDECNDTNGKALFKGILHGQVKFTGNESSEVSLDGEVLDCELKYNSGMSC